MFYRVDIASIGFAKGYADPVPGSLRGTQLNVDDLDAVRAGMVNRGVDVSAIQEYPWGRFCFFSDPDGNDWSVHEPPPPAGRFGTWDSLIHWSFS